MFLNYLPEAIITVTAALCILFPIFSKYFEKNDVEFESDNKEFLNSIKNPKIKSSHPFDFVTYFASKHVSPMVANKIMNVGLFLGLLSSIFLITIPPLLNTSGFSTGISFSMFFKSLILVSSLKIGLTSLRQVKVLGRQLFKYNFFFLAATFGAMLLAAADNFLSLFLSVEILSLALCFLVVMQKRTGSFESGIKFFISGTIATATMLFAISFLYSQFNTFEFSKVLFVESNIRNSFYVNFFEILFFMGILFKLGTVPFQTWISDTSKNSNLSLGLFISSVVKIGGFAALIKCVNILVNTGSLAQFTLMFLSIATLLVANILALRVQNTKRFLAYSTIANIGYITLLTVYGSTGAVAASTLCLVLYLIANLGIWTSFMQFSLNHKRCYELNDLRGIGYTNPFFAMMMALCMFSLIGLPFLGGFIGKFYMFAEILKSGYGGIIPILFIIISSIFAILYYTRIVSILYKKPQSAKEFAQKRFRKKVNAYTTTLAFCTILLFITFFCSSFLIKICNLLV